MKKIISKDLDFEKQLKDILSFDRGVPANIEETVKKIITDIKSNGDEAVIKLTNELDNNNLNIVDLLVTDDEINEASDQISKEDNLPENLKKVICN